MIGVLQPQPMYVQAQGTSQPYLYGQGDSQTYTSPHMSMLMQALIAARRRAAMAQQASQNQDPTAQQASQQMPGVPGPLGGPGGPIPGGSVQGPLPVPQPVQMPSALPMAPPGGGAGPETPGGAAGGPMTADGVPTLPPHAFPGAPTPPGAGRAPGMGNAPGGASPFSLRMSAPTQAGQIAAANGQTSDLSQLVDALKTNPQLRLALQQMLTSNGANTAAQTTVPTS